VHFNHLGSVPRRSPNQPARRSPRAR
jgi:hypothetical protein